MAVNKNAKLQRTQRGEEELRKKSHVLTQTERLILALVDGTTAMGQLQQKISGVVERRFKLVVADLNAKGLLEDVAELPKQDAQEQMKKVDPATLVNFVCQDPLDPVTITALCIRRTGKEKVVQDPVVQPVMPSSPLSKEVDFYLPLEPAPADQDSLVLKPVPNLVMTNSMGQEDESSAKRRMRRAERSRQVQIGYWLLFAGLVCTIVLLVILQSRG